MRQLSEQDIAIIGSKGWLSLLSDDARSRMLSRCVVGHTERGKALYRIGEAPSGLYYIASGCIRMDTVQSAHGPTTLNLFHTGSWLGEVELFSGMPRLTTLFVARPTMYLFLSRSTLEGISKEYPEVWRCLGHLAAEHVALAVAALDDMAIRPMSARLAAIILRLTGARIDNDPLGHTTELDVTQSELAQIANLSRSMTAELLREFDRHGIVERRYGGLKVNDLPALRQMLETGNIGTHENGET